MTCHGHSIVPPLTRGTCARYVLEVVTYVAVVLVFIVYTDTFYILPLLAKTVLTLATWVSVKRVYNNSFGTFYTKETEAIIY